MSYNSQDYFHDQKFIESDVDGKENCLNSIEKSIDDLSLKKDDMSLDFDKIQFKLKRNYVRLNRLREFTNVCQELAERNLFKDFIESISFFIAEIIDFIKREPKFLNFNRSVSGLKMFLTATDYQDKESDVSLYMNRLKIMERFGLDESSKVI